MGQDRAGIPWTLEVVSFQLSAGTRAGRGDALGSMNRPFEGANLVVPQGKPLTVCVLTAAMILRIHPKEITKNVKTGSTGAHHHLVMLVKTRTPQCPEMLSA